MKVHFLDHSFRFIIGLLYTLLLMPLLLNAKGIEDASTYHGNSVLQWNIASRVIDTIEWKGNECVLDVGCGDGKITALLAQKLPEGSVVGIDISQSMIDFASHKYAEIEYPNLNFQKLDAAEITFENQFDVVTSFSALHWVMDQEKALKAIHQALNPGGAVYIQTYGAGVMNITMIADSLINTKKWSQYFPTYVKQRVFFTDTEYQDLLESAGFQQVSVTGSWHNTTFDDRQALIHFAKPLLNFIDHLSLELQQEFVEEVVDKVISIAGILDDGTIQYKTFSLHAFGVK